MINFPAAQTIRGLMLRACLLLAVLSLSSLTAQAANITWGTPATLSADSDVSTVGTLLYAYDQSNTASTVNGVAFTAGSSATALGTNITLSGFTGGVNNTAFSSFTGASTAYANILKGASYTTAATAATVTLNNLTSGKTYLVQVWVEDSRVNSNMRTETVTKAGTDTGNTVTLNYASNSSAGAAGQYTIGYFVATTTTQAFTLTGNASTQLNAIQVRDLGVAAAGTWTNTSGGLWGTGTNWSGGTVANGATTLANFNTLDITSDVTVNLDSARVIGSLTFGDTTTSSAAGWILANNGTAANTLSLAGTISPTITVNTLGTGKIVTISAVISGNDGMTLAGTGTLNLTGSNTFTGPTAVTGGTLKLGNATALTTTSGVTVSSGATLDTNGQPATGTTRTLTISGAGVSSAGAVTNSGADQQNTFHNLTLAANATIGGSGRMDIRSGTTPTLTLAGFTLTVANPSFNLIGTTVSATTGTGAISVSNGGSLGVQTSTTFPATTNTITLNGSGVLEMFALTTATPSTWTLAVAASGTQSWQTDAGTGTNNTWGGPITLGSNLTLNSNGFVMTASGVISGAFGLSKISAGTATLSGASTYTGSTSVTAGTLALTSAASLANTAISVTNSGSALTVSTTAAGSVNIGSTATSTAGATLSLGAGTVFSMVDGNIGTTNLQQGATFATTALTLSGATLNFEASGATVDKLAVTKTASVTGTNTINITPVAALTAGGPYNIITASGGLTGTFQFPNGSTTELVAFGANSYILTLNVGATAVSITVATGSGLTWTGQTSGNGANDSNWNTTGSTNWASALTPIGFVNGNAITFQDTNTVTSSNVTNSTVTIQAGGITSGSTTFNNTAVDYSVSGGAIGGAGSLTKSGTGTVTLSTLNTYTGATTVNAGTLIISGTGYLYGAGQPGSATSVTVATGATLNLTGAATNNVLGFGTNETWTVGGTINSSGGSAQTLPTTVNLNSGTLTGIASTGTNAQYGTYFSNSNLTIIATGTSAITAGNIGMASGTLTLSTPSAGDALSISSVLGVNTNIAANVSKTGPGTVTFTGTSIYTGNTTFSAGTLIAQNNNAFGTGSLLLSGAGTTLILAKDTALTLANATTVSQNMTIQSDTLTSVAGVTHTLGTLSIGAQTLTITTGSHATGTTAGITFGATTISGTSSAANFSPAANTTLTLGTVTGTTPTITMSGAGSLVLSGTISTATALTINSGTVTMNTNNSTTNAALTVNSPGTLKFTLGEIFGVLNGNGSIDLSGGINWLYTNSASNGTFSGIISGSSGYIKQGAGTETLTGANTFSGSGLSGASAVQIQGGNLSVASINYVTSGNWANHLVGSNLGIPANASVGTIALGSSTTAGTLTYTGTGETTDRVINLAGTTFGGVIDQSGTGLLKFTSSNTATVAGAKTLTLQGSTAGTGEISGIIVNSSSGATAISKLGTGTWTLSGASTLTGGITVSAGELDITTWGSSNPGAITVGNAANAATLGISGGTLALGGSNFVVETGSTSAYVGTVNQSGGTVSFTSGNGLLVGNGSAGSGTYNLSGGTLSATFAAASTTRGVILGVNTGTSATFNLSGTGTLTLSNTILQIGRSDSGASTTTNLYNQTAGTATMANVAIGGATTTSTNVTSTMTISGGTFSATNFLKLANGNNDIVAINFNGGTTTLPAFPTARGTGASATVTFNGGTLKANAASTTYLSGLSNLFIKSGGATIDSGGFAITVSQNLLTDAVSTGGGFSKAGTGVLTLTGANTYTGPTTISAGTLAISAQNNLGDASQATNSISLGGTLNSTGGTYDLGINRAITLTATSTIQNDAGTLTISSDIANSTRTLTLSGAGSIIVNGVIGTGATPTGGLTIGTTAASTTVTLNGNNLFTGNVILPASNTTPNSILIITNSGALGVGPKTVQSAGGGEIHLQNNITLASNISFTTSGSFTQNSVNTGRSVIYNDSGNNTINGIITMTNSDGSTIITSTSGLLTLAGDITNNVTGRVLDLRGNGNGVISGVIKDGVGTTPVTKSANTGTWTFSGINTYSGGTTISAGTLALSGSGTLGATANTLALSGGTLDLGTTSQTVGAVTVSVASALADDTIKNGNLTGTLYSATNTTGNAIISAVLQGASNFTINGAGGTLTLSGTNTYSGITTLTAGTLVLATQNPIQNSTLVMNGGSLVFDQSVVGNAFAIGGLEAANSGAGYDIVLQNNATVPAAITLSVGNNNDITTYAGVLSGPGGLTKVGPATLALSGANSYTGATSVNAGTLLINTPGTLGAATTDLNLNGGALNLGATTQTVGAVTVTAAASGSDTLSNGSLTGTSYAVSNSTGNAIISANLLVSGAAGFSKSGAGAATLSGANTYAGATNITNGTLKVSGTGDINASSGITINGSAAKFVQTSSVASTPAITQTLGTLDGTGTVGAVTVADDTNNIITAGNGGSGALTMSSLTFSGAATINLSQSYGSVTSLSVGALTTSAGIVTVNVSNNGSWANNADYTLISYTGGTILGSGFASFLKGTITGLTSLQTATLVDTGSAIVLHIGGESPYWTGLQTNVWTTTPVGGASNWILKPSNVAYDFQTNDAVIFDDTASSSTVSIDDANVGIINATFNNTTLNYTLTSASTFGISSGSLLKQGTGSLTILNANTYSGGTNLVGGSLIIQGDSALGNGGLAFNGTGTLAFNTGAGVVTMSRAMTVNGAATIDSTNVTSLTLAGVIGGAGGSLTLTGGKTIALQNSNTYLGGTTLLNGSIAQINSAFSLGDYTGALTFGTGGGTVLLDATAGSITSTRPYHINNAATIDTNVVGNTLTLNGVLDGGAGLTVNGAGTVVLNANNTYAGVTTVNAGVLIAGSSTAFGPAASAALDFGLTGNGQVKLNGNDITVIGLNSTTTSSIVMSGAVGTGTDVLTVNNAIDNTYAGTLQNGLTRSLSLTKTDAGILTLSNLSSTFTGNININGGTLSVTTGQYNGVGANTAFGKTNVARNIVVNNGGTLNFASGDALIGNAATPAATLVINAGGLVTNTGNNFNTLGPINLNGGTLTGTGGSTNTQYQMYQLRNTVTVAGTTPSTISLTGNGNSTNGYHLNGAITFDVADVTGDAGTDLTVSGLLMNGVSGTPAAGGVTKTSAGTMLLSGANTYTGATLISGGTLKAGSSSALGSGSAVTVTSPGILDLNGNNLTIGSLVSSTGNITDNSTGTGITKLTISGTTSANSTLITDGINGQHVALVLTNPNGTSFLNNTNNTYSGGTYLVGATASGARLNSSISSTGTPGALTNGTFGTGTIYIGQSPSDYAQIFLNTANLTINYDITSNSVLGTDVSSTIRIDSTATNLVFAGTLTANLANFQIGGYTGGSISLTGKVTGPKGLYLANAVYQGSTRNATGAVNTTLNNASANPNDYAGDTTVDNYQTLTLGASDQIPNGVGKGNLTINGFMNMKGFNETVNGLNGTTTATTLDGGGTGTIGTPSNTLTIGDNDATGSFAGVIKNTTGTLTLSKIGTGTETLSGSNTFLGGTNIKNGILILDGGTDRLANTGVLTIGDVTTSGKLVLGGSVAVSQTLTGVATTGLGGSVVGGNTANSTLVLNIATSSSYSGALGGIGTNENNLALTKSGAGTLVLSGANNTYVGDTNIGINGTGTRNGVLRAAATQALGTGTVLIGLGGNDATARLELTGDISLGNAIALPGRNNTTVAIENISGNNTLSGTVTISSGGTDYRIQSDAGKLTLSGATSITSAATGTRLVTIQGAGDSEVSGIIANGSATSLSLTKADAGKLTLSGTNSYTGTTNINNGKLYLGTGGSMSATAVTVSATGTYGLAQTSGSSVIAGSTLTTVSGATLDLQDGVSSAFNFTGTGNTIDTTTIKLDLSSTVNVGDNVAITGTATITNPTFAINAIGGLANGQYTLVSTGGLTLVGTISGTSATSGKLLAYSNDANNIYVNITDAANNSQIIISGATQTNGATAATIPLGRALTGSALTTTSQTIAKSASSTTYTVASLGDVSTTTFASGSFGANTATANGTITLDSSSVGSKSGTVTIANTAVDSAGAGLGSADGNDVFTVTGTVVAVRTVVAPASTALGNYHAGAAVSIPSNNFSSTYGTGGDGSHANTEDALVAASTAGPDANGITLTGGPDTLNTAGTFTRTFSGIAAVSSSGGSISSAVTRELSAATNVSAAYTIGVYTGNMLWSGSASSNWSTASNWTDNVSGGIPFAPGLDAGFTHHDTATFGDGAVTGNIAVHLNGASPYLKSMTFNSIASYTIDAAGSEKLNLANSNGVTITATGTHTITTPISIANNLTVYVTNSTDILTISGDVTGNTGTSLTKNDFGTLVMNGISSYSGGMDVANGTLRGTGTFNNQVLVENAGTLWPGLATSGSAVPDGGEVMTVDSLDLYNIGLANGTLKIALKANGNQQLVVTGSTCDLTGATLALDIESSTALGTFTIISCSSTNAITGQFANFVVTTDNVTTTYMSMPPFLTVNYPSTGDAVTITLHPEGDSAPLASGGDGLLDATDITQLLRFTVGLDLPSAADLQRADVAPLTAKGDGLLDALDVTQLLRYTVDLDPKVLVGGPTQPAAPPQAQLVPNRDATDAVRMVMANPIERGGNANSIFVEIDATGIENAISFDVAYDAAQLSYVSAAIGAGAKGYDTTGNSTLTSEMRVTANVKKAGVLSVVMNFPTSDYALDITKGSTLRILELKFAAPMTGSAASTEVSFVSNATSAPMISDTNAHPVTATFTGVTASLVAGREYSWLGASGTNYIALIGNSGDPITMVSSK